MNANSSQAQHTTRSNSCNNVGDFAAKAFPLILQGIPVFPCTPDKRPHTANGFRDATTDMQKVNDWNMLYPQALVGVPTGAASGIDVVDIDVKADGGGTVIADGFESLKLFPALPPTVVHKTTRGEHRLFRTNGSPLRCTAGKIAPGVDTRGDGGYIIWWPAEGKERNGDALAELPAWVKQSAAQDAKPKQSKDESTVKQSGSDLCPLEQLPELLAHLDPDMTRMGDGEGWATVGMGIRQAFGEDGFPAWLEWSKTGKKFVSERDCAAQWRGFRERADGIGFGTVIKLAIEAGWEPPAPDVSGMFASVPQERAQQREQTRRIGEGLDFDPFPEQLSGQDMVDRFVFLADGSRVFDRKFPAHVLGFPDFRNMTAKNVDHVPTGEFDRRGEPKTKAVARADAWMRSDNRLSAVSTTFKPGGGLFVSDPNGRHCANLWNGYRQGVLAEQWAVELLFVGHVRWLFKDRADDFLDWLAHIQQKPGELPHTAWLHISSHTGTGRNWLSSLVARVWAGHVAASLDLEHTLDSGFNERLSRKVLAVVDEIRVGGQQWNHAEALKQIITAEVRNINTKYGRMSMEFNACRFLLFSNHRSAIPIDDADRRFEVVINDAPPMDAEYYATLYAALADPAFIRGVAWWLSQRNIAAFNPGRHAAMSAAKQQVIHMSTPEAVVNMREFSEAYPCELVTADRLAAAAGISTFGKSAMFFARAAEECGWISIKRKWLANGKRPVLYARREAAMKWVDVPRGFESQLPVVDGGKIDWSAAGFDARINF